MSDALTPRICALCTTPARYKCPCCATPTCSLYCSRKHKQDTGCSGERDKVKYVPMNAYDWGIMMRDYCYLEQVGRKVSEWGSDIVRGGYMAHRPANIRKSQGPGRSKRDALGAHLESVGIEVELLPQGMERRNLSQSTFNQKSNCCLLTVEFVFYPPSTLASMSSSPPPPYKTFAHRNRLSTTLLTVLQHQVSLMLSKSRKQNDTFPDWLPSMVNPHPEAPECFTPPHCYMRANTEFPQVPNATNYHKLEPTLTLGELLQGTTFVEFPTVHVFDPGASSFCGTVIDKSGLIVREVQHDQVGVARATKRRKLDQKAGLKAVFSLVGEYESEVEEEIKMEQPTGLAALETYSESDNEEIPTDAEVDDGQSVYSGDDVDPEVLLELAKQAGHAADEDILDWGDEWDIDQEC